MKALLTFLICWIASCCYAAGVCPQPGQGDWAAACFWHTEHGRQIKPAYLHNVHFDAGGHAVLRIAESFELVAVDRRGAVVVPDIFYLTDFDYPRPRGHLARFREGGKCGYFDVRNFKIVIPAAYDQCMSFRDGRGRACVDCKAYCTDPDCHDSIFVGGKGLDLDDRGRVAREFALPPLALACPGKQPGALRQQGSGSVWLNCPGDPGAPFKLD
jgi:hypothetical protein